jgi:hypothetical protein
MTVRCLVFVVVGIRYHGFIGCLCFWFIFGFQIGTRWWCFTGKLLVGGLCDYLNRPVGQCEGKKRGVQLVCFGGEQEILDLLLSNRDGPRVLEVLSFDQSAFEEEIDRRAKLFDLLLVNSLSVGG